jgi:2-oxoglutarate dehydrogenase E1 component
VVIGMAHRGRLNVLAHIVGIGYGDILREFEGVAAHGVLAVPGTGDVKYHHGAEGEYALADGSSIGVTLAPNPSHLEFVNPVVMGMTRSLQFGGEGRSAVQDTSAVVPILIHGDAAFAAEGVVAETLNLGRLPAYSVGGTIHLIANNQIGFTTDPGEGRSTRYASDLAKGFDLPILHVNADRPEACVAAVRLAMAYRAEYADDVVIDLVGYRRHGHNEGDEPAYTQPTLYQEIAGHATVRALWAGRLVEEGVVSERQAARLQDAVAEHLREVLDGIQSEEAAGHAPDRPAPVEAPETDTGVPVDALIALNARALAWPDDFTVHPKLARQLERRRQDFGPETRIEWAHAETLAFGSLLAEGYVIRLTGQDSQRGTFSQRHLVLHDVETGRIHVPLAEVGEGRLEVHNSPLSETAVVGYEYGYSVAAERDLILWEAQFGDFVNAAQVAVDQFVASGKEKWNQHANLTLLLPHGYEGQGPEHSSARLERFLQICAEGNLKVAYPSTPAQYFHLLRRQAHTRPERPLVVMTPKSLLRLPAAASAVSELGEGRFRAVIEDPTAADRRGEITRLVLCSGKVYYDLQGSELRKEAATLAIGRVEELYPFPGESLEELVRGYANLEEVVWVQEEPRNMGALTFVGPLLRSVVARHITMRWVARPERASPAEGKASDHRREQERIVREALGVGGA